MPLETIEDAPSGFNGLIVVAARWNARKPATAKLTPRATSDRAMAARQCHAISRAGSWRATTHIARPVRRVTIGGGIFSSNADMTLLYSREAQIPYAILAD